MQVFLKQTKAKRIYLCGRIIDALENGAFEVTEEEYALNEAVLEPVDKSHGKVIKPTAEEVVKPKRAAKKAE